MARFDQDSFQVSYKYEGHGDDDMSLWRWTMTEPFPVPGYGPVGGAFTAEVVQRREGRWEPWSFLPRVAMQHRETDLGRLGDSVRSMFTEPMVTLDAASSFDEAIWRIKEHVRKACKARAWDGAGIDDAWWAR